MVLLQGYPWRGVMRWQESLTKKGHDIGRRFSFEDYGVAGNETRQQQADNLVRLGLERGHGVSWSGRAMLLLSLLVRDHWAEERGPVQVGS